MNDQANELAIGSAALTELTEVIANQIRKLAELHKEGHLTDEEFTSKKTELLSRL